MKKGRPASANTIYKVSIHNNGGRKYASTQPFTVNENGKKHYPHKHWGIVDDNMKLHPNSTYFYASLEDRRKPRILSTNYCKTQIKMGRVKQLIKKPRNQGIIWLTCKIKSVSLQKI